MLFPGGFLHCWWTQIFSQVFFFFLFNGQFNVKRRHSQTFWGLIRFYECFFFLSGPILVPAVPTLKLSKRLSLFFLNKNQRTSKWGLKDILQNIPWVMSNVYLAWCSEAAALIPALSATRVVLGYKRSSPCPQLISARLVISPSSMHIRPAVTLRLCSLWPPYSVGISWTFLLTLKQFTCGDALLTPCRFVCFSTCCLSFY